MSYKEDYATARIVLKQEVCAYGEDLFNDLQWDEEKIKEFIVDMEHEDEVRDYLEAVPYDYDQVDVF